jgi:transposase InsO family protein
LSDEAWRNYDGRNVAKKRARTLVEALEHYGAPNANAYAERFVRSIKEECLDRLVPFGERHFRHAVTEFVDHYHYERNHQGLGNRLIGGATTGATAARVRRRPRLGGLLNFYERAA